MKPVKPPQAAHPVTVPWNANACPTTLLVHHTRNLFHTVNDLTKGNVSTMLKLH